MKSLSLWVLLILLAALTSGCASRAPTIAHTHLGHATTTWKDTPDQMGLMVVAEEKAQEAFEHAKRAEKHGSDIDVARAEISKVLFATDPLRTKSTAIKAEPPYGLKQALVGAMDHITFAANSVDATQNVKRFASGFTGNSTAILDRCDLITVLGEDIVASSSAEEVEVLTQEVFTLAQANLNGADTDGDGIVGNTPEEYGLRQLRAELEAMLAREDPPYTTVSRWYLLNLIRLPTGEWTFRELPTGGGYGGGYGTGY